MKQEVQEKVLFNIMNAPFMGYPSPMFVHESVFPEEFYDELLEKLPPTEAYENIVKAGYVIGDDQDDSERYVFNLKTDTGRLEDDIRPFWEGVHEFLAGPRFVNAMLLKFHPYLQRRFGQTLNQQKWVFQLKLNRDFKGYSLGPHTDTSDRVLNVFFYLPKDNKRPKLGTSFYVPKDPGMICHGGPRYPFEDFVNVYTTPYKRNVMAGFFKTQKSFHGVEPVKGRIERNALALTVGIKTEAK